MKELEKTNFVTNANIELGEDTGKGKGRYFRSRFIEAGIAHYDELGDILIRKETLDKFIHTMVGCPVIINHKNVTDKNVDKLRVGVISKVWFCDFDGWYYCEGIITDAQAIDLIKNQGWNVSCAYSFVSDNLKKIYHGKEIDMEFIDGEFLHLAIVDNPRYEGANIVVNNKSEKEDEKEQSKENKEYFKKAENNIEKEKTFMSVMNELKDFVLSVVNKTEEKVENEDKRKLIDEIGGILKDKVDEEVWRTIIGKIEKVAYKGSEDSKVDNEASEEEKEEKFEEEKEIATNEEEDEEEKDKKDFKEVHKEEKALKKEDEEHDKKMKEKEKEIEMKEEKIVYDKNKEEKEAKNKCKNSMDKIKDMAMGGNNITEKSSSYSSQKERLELGNKF